METAERTVAGRYRLIEQLGSGGMGIVWRAEDTLLGRGVALKEVTFPAGVSEDEREALSERTRREARAAARLSHPSAVTIFDVADEGGTPFLVMELVQARSLAEVIESDGPLTPRRTAEIGLAVLGALEAAHEQGIVHRDVKPSNVLIADDGRVVLTDFGIATFTGDASITSTGLLVGSPSYISPERASGEQPGPAADLWSLGATLFTAVEGRPPFDRGAALPTLAAVMTQDHAPFVAAGPLAAVLDGLLDKDHTTRYDAQRARTALEQVRHSGAASTRPLQAPLPAATESSGRTQVLDLGALPEPVPYPEGNETLPPPPRAGRPWLPVALVLALLVIAAGVLLLKDRTPGDRETGSSGSADGNPSSVPKGWVTRSHDSWTVAVPTSYRVSTFAGLPQYKDPSTGRTLRVSATAQGGGRADAVQDRRDQAKAFDRTHENYREIAISDVDYRGLEAADWEFTYTSGGAALHALNRVFVDHGRGYSLFFQTRAGDDWDKARQDFERMAAGFRPQAA